MHNAAPDVSKCWVNERIDIRVGVERRPRCSRTAVHIREVLKKPTGYVCRCSHDGRALSLLCKCIAYGEAGNRTSQDRGG
jgi:hypothetical protein